MVWATSRRKADPPQFVNAQSELYSDQEPVSGLYGAGAWIAYILIMSHVVFNFLRDVWHAIQHHPFIHPYVRCRECPDDEWDLDLLGSVVYTAGAAVDLIKRSAVAIRDPNPVTSGAVFGSEYCIQAAGVVVYVGLGAFQMTCCMSLNLFIVRRSWGLFGVESWFQQFIGYHHHRLVLFLLLLLASLAGSLASLGASYRLHHHGIAWPKPASWEMIGKQGTSFPSISAKLSRAQLFPSELQHSITPRFVLDVTIGALPVAAVCSSLTVVWRMYKNPRIIDEPRVVWIAQIRRRLAIILVSFIRYLFIYLVIFVPLYLVLFLLKGVILSLVGACLNDLYTKLIELDS
jgi:hypothetical protein